MLKKPGETNPIWRRTYFPEAGNLIGSNADMCSDVARQSSSGSGDLFELSDGLNETIILPFPRLLALLAAVFDLSVATTPILPSGRVTSSYIRSFGWQQGCEHGSHLFLSGTLNDTLFLSVQ